MICFPKKKGPNSLFSDLFFTFVQNFKPKKKRLFMACIFENFQLHSHILKEFLSMMVAI